MQIDRIDHLVLTVRDIDATCEFYARVLHMEPVTSKEGRRALHFGRQKLNLHPAASPVPPHALHPTPGSGDLCFITGTSIDEVVAHCHRLGVPVEEGPSTRTGAAGPMTSIYLRDPDSNLIEISVYKHAG